MPRTSGRRGKLIVDTAGTPAAEGAASTAAQVLYIADYSVDQAQEQIEVSAFGDTTKTYVRGLADASGSLNGFLDDDSLDIYTLADGEARSFYLYVDSDAQAPVGSSGKGYWYGMGTFDVSTSQAVNGAVQISLNWAASSSITRL